MKDKKRLFSCEEKTKKIYELNPDTKKVIATYDTLSTDPTNNMGEGRLWGVDWETKKIYEHNPDTMEVITIYDAPERGIGGMNERKK